MSLYLIGMFESEQTFQILGYILVFIFGAAIGSFLNVVIHRVPREESVIFPHSACPKCGHKIKFYDNIPILSWLILGGKCRGCKEPISFRYPAIELANALLYLLVVWQIGLTPYLPVALLFASTMLALMMIDAEHMILPNVITYPMFVIALIVRVAYPLVFDGNFFSDTHHSPISMLSDQPAWLVSLAGALFGALIGGGSLWLVGELWQRFRGIEAMGLGDVKLMLGIGALLGWRLCLLTIFLGALSGAVIGIAMIVKQKDKNMQAQIPFGIFLGIGSILSMLFGDRLITWYMSMYS